MAKKDDILTEMVTMRLREDAAAAYRGKTPAERREIMQQLRERLDELLFPYGISKSAPIVQPGTAARVIKQQPSTVSPNSGEPTKATGTRRRPPIPND